MHANNVITWKSFIIDLEQIFPTLLPYWLLYGESCKKVVRKEWWVEGEGLSLFVYLKARLHGHAIFGVVSVSDTCRTPERVRLAKFRCPASVSFFFFFSLLRHGSDTPAVKKKKRKSQILTYQYHWFCETTSLRSPETHISSSHFSTHPPSALPAAAAALCSSPELDRADRRAPSTSTPCLSLPISLSLGVRSYLFKLLSVFSFFSDIRPFGLGEWLNGLVGYL